MSYASLPIDDAVAVPDRKHPLSEKLPKLKLGVSFQRWLSGLRAVVDSNPVRLAHTLLQSQAASIGTTPLSIASVTQGIWRISVTVRVTRAATTSSELLVTILWTERAVTQTEATTNLTTNVTTTREGKTFLIRSDASQPISYAVTYASVGGTSMQYSLDIVAELLSADPT